MFLYRAIREMNRNNSPRNSHPRLCVNHSLLFSLLLQLFKFEKLKHPTNNLIVCEQLK